MKKLILIAATMAMAIASEGAFPYSTNTSYNKASDISSDYTNFSFNSSGYDDEVISMFWDIPVTNAIFRIATREGTQTVYLDVLGTVTAGTNFIGTIDRTNLPPKSWAPYNAELLGYNAVSYTSAPTRSIAKGTWMQHDSLFNITNNTSWTNPAAGTIIGPPIHDLTDLTGWGVCSSWDE